MRRVLMLMASAFIAASDLGAADALACSKATVSLRTRGLTPEPFSAQVTAEPLLAAVTAGPGEPCKGTLVIRRPSARGEKAPGVFSVSRSAASADKLTGDDQAFDEVTVAPVNLEGGKSLAIQLFTLFQYDQSPDVVKAGSYMYNVDFFIRADQGKQEAVSARGVRVTIPARTSVRAALTESSFDSASGSADVNFGELEEGKRRSFYLVARSTAPYRFSVTSENGWRLRREGKEAGEETLVDYSLWTSGRTTAAPGSPRTIAFTPENAGATGYEGKSYAAEARIGSTDRKRAGSYSDVLTITAAAEH